MAGVHGLGALAPTPNFASSVFNVYVCITFSICIQCVRVCVRVCVCVVVFFLCSIELERVPGEASAASNHLMVYA